jgi:hypothetical protein
MTLALEVEKILRKEPGKMYSREEILNLLASKKKDRELEQLLAELEIASSPKADIYATCRGGTVYYKWNKS